MLAVSGDRRAVELGQPAVPTLRRAPSYHACRASRILHRASPVGGEHAGWLEVSQSARMTKALFYLNTTVSSKEITKVFQGWFVKPKAAVHNVACGRGVLACTYRQHFRRTVLVWFCLCGGV